MGSLLIKALIRPGEISTASGLYFINVVPNDPLLWGFTNINDNAEIVEMIASGCYILFVFNRKKF